VFGRIVMIPSAAVKVLRVVSLPPKTLISTTGRSSSQVTPVAFVSTALPVYAEIIPAASRPSGVAPRSRYSAGMIAPSKASVLAVGASGGPDGRLVTSAPVNAASSLAAASDPWTIPRTAPPLAPARPRARVATSVDSLVRAPSATSPITRNVGAIR
jgi:hypothetical protein